MRFGVGLVPNPTRASELQGQATLRQALRCSAPHGPMARRCKKCGTIGFAGNGPKKGENRILRPLRGTATGRTRTVNLRFTKPLAESVTSGTTSTYDKSDSRLPPSLPEILRDRPDLAAVVAAWDDLPNAIRAGILAMVRAAGADE